jgi:hypothetical protein
MSEDSKTGTTIVDEYKSKFGSHPVRIERFKITQQSKISATAEYLTKSGITERSEFYALIYEFLATEDLYHEKITVFMEDFGLICEEFGHPLDRSLEDEIIADVVTPYIQALKFQTDIFFDLSRWLIQKLGQGWDPMLARSYATNDYFKPLMTTLIEKFPHVKITFLSAMAWTTLARYINRDESINIKLIDKIQQVRENYPNELTGTKYAFDLAFRFLLIPNWNLILKLIDNEVEKVKKSIEIEREIMQKESQAVKAAQVAAAQADPIDDAKNAVAMKINELFGFGYEINESKESQIEKAFALFLRRVALKEFGHVAAETVEPIKKAVEDFIWPEVLEHPIIIAKGINVKSKFYDPNYKDPEMLMEEFTNNPSYIEEFRGKFFDKIFSGYRGGADYDTLAKNFVQIIKSAKS